jgi:hypothetical protein
MADNLKAERLGYRFERRFFAVLYCSLVLFKE